MEQRMRGGSKDTKAFLCSVLALTFWLKNSSIRLSLGASRGHVSPW